MVRGPKGSPYPLNPCNPWQAARGRSLMARAHGSSEAKTRREEEVMLLHHDDEQRSIRLRTPMRPKGYGDVTPSALLPPLNDVPASLSARRLASGATSP